jgi:universal stress protein E
MTTALETAPSSTGADPQPTTHEFGNPALRGPIVLAIHGGEISHAPIIAARLMAQRLKRAVHAVTVIEPVTVYGGVMDIVPATELMSPYFADVQEEGVKRHLREIFGGDEGWTLETRFGLAAREITQAARDADATLVIVDAAPRRALRHAVSGIRALQVVRGLPCPVVSVTSEFAALPRQIVAAVDFSPASIRAVQAAMLFADEHATIALVHDPFPIHLEHTLTDRTGAVIGGEVEELFHRLLAELRGYAPPTVRLTTKILEGRIAPEILRVADEQHADLIVAGTHGPNPVERLFVGSVAAGLLHLAHCTVLVSPAPPAGEFVRLEARMSDTAVTVNRAEWKDVLESVSRRNAGRRVSIEEDDPAFGAQVEAHGYVLRGAAYDPNDRRVEIMLGAPGRPGTHLTRTIEEAETLAINTTPHGEDRAIAIGHDQGQTLVLFEGRP